MRIRSRVGALERHTRRAVLVSCPRCRHAAPLREDPAAPPPLPPSEELRRLFP
jgi:hypothetical protein